MEVHAIGETTVACFPMMMNDSQSTHTKRNKHCHIILHAVQMPDVWKHKHVRRF